MCWPNPFVMAKLIYNQLTPTKNLALCFATAHSKHIKFPHSLSAGKHRRVLWEADDVCLCIFQSCYGILPSDTCYFFPALLCSGARLITWHCSLYMNISGNIKVLTDRAKEINERELCYMHSNLKVNFFMNIFFFGISFL